MMEDNMVPYPDLTSGVVEGTGDRGVYRTECVYKVQYFVHVWCSYIHMYVFSSTVLQYIFIVIGISIVQLLTCNCYVNFPLQSQGYMVP